jgi:hypothetical protein
LANQRYELTNKFDNLLNEIEVKADVSKNIKLHEVEGDILKAVLDLGRQLLLYFIYLVKQEWENNSFIIEVEGKQKTYRNKGIRSRGYHSIFGEIPINRKRYFCKGSDPIYFLDQQLGLPASNYSYLLQDWLGQSSSERTFASSSKMLNKILSLNLKGMQSHRICEGLISTGSIFYEDKQICFDTDSKEYMVGSFDGKGLPIRAEDAERKVESSAIRLSKGQRQDTKREATVSVNYHCKPRVRTSQEVADSYFGQKNNTNQKKEKQSDKKKSKKHIRAFLSDQKKGVAYGMELLAKSATQDQPLLILIDGAKGLEKKVDKLAEELGIKDRIEAKILDFVHVTEYVWKAANAFLGERSPLRVEWVKKTSKQLLDGEVKAVIKHLEECLKKPSPSGNPLTKNVKKPIQKAITYFKNHEKMMAYDYYLSKGMPIATGVVESACGYYVQQRFDTNGMHWSEKGAKGLLDLRAINLNEDWEEMMKEHIENEHDRIYENYPKMAA